MPAPSFQQMRTALNSAGTLAVISDTLTAGRKASKNRVDTLYDQLWTETNLMTDVDEAWRTTAFIQLMLAFVNNGTTNLTYAIQTRFSYTKKWSTAPKDGTAGIPDTTHLDLNRFATHFRKEVRSRPGTVRAFWRYFADFTYDTLKENPHQISPALCVRYGIPSDLPYLAFDWADAITPSKLTNREAIAIGNAVYYNTLKNPQQQTSASTSTAVVFNPGYSRAQAAIPTNQLKIGN